MLALIHAKNTLAVVLTVYDGDYKLVDLSGMMQVLDVNEIDIDFGGAITGTWTYILQYWNT